LALCRNRPDLREPLSESGDIGAQVLFAIHEEAALTLDDVVMRRTGIGQLGNPGIDRLNRVADIMAAELCWDEARKRSELASIQRNFQLTTAPQ
jgi:glycerol-3-phosphate dehydrogenase